MTAQHCFALTPGEPAGIGPDLCLLLAQQVAQRWQQQPLNWGLLVRGHGLYVWGRSLDEAKRHLEGWEFLINCELERLKLTR